MKAMTSETAVQEFEVIVSLLYIALIKPNDVKVTKYNSTDCNTCSNPRAETVPIGLKKEAGAPCL